MMTLEQTIIFVLSVLLVTTIIIILKLKTDIKFLKATLVYQDMINNLEKEVS